MFYYFDRTVLPVLSAVAITCVTALSISLLSHLRLFAITSSRCR